MGYPFLAPRDGRGTGARDDPLAATARDPLRLGPRDEVFAGPDDAARHWAIVASLVVTAKLNGVEPSAWIADVLERVVLGRTKANELERLLPWSWKAERIAAAVDA
jgi:transposase